MQRIDTLQDLRSKLKHIQDCAFHCRYSSLSCLSHVDKAEIWAYLRITVDATGWAIGLVDVLMEPETGDPFAELSASPLNLPDNNL